MINRFTTLTKHPANLPENYFNGDGDAKLVDKMEAEREKIAKERVKAQDNDSRPLKFSSPIYSP